MRLDAGRRSRYTLPRALAAACLTVTALAAQAGPQVLPPPVAAPPQQPDKQKMYETLDQIRAAIQSNNWTLAWQLTSQFNSWVSVLRARAARVPPELELQHLEVVAGRDNLTRSPQLPAMARAAYAAGQYAKAETYARDAIESARIGQFWWTGDAVHQGNIVLGRLALRRGDIPGAASYLLAAGNAPPSLMIAALGPNMSLALDLLRRDQWDPVIQYLEECKTLWTTGGRQLAEWTALLRAKLIPDFGPNVDY